MHLGNIGNTISGVNIAISDKILREDEDVQHTLSDITNLLSWIEEYNNNLAQAALSKDIRKIRWHAAELFGIIKQITDIIQEISERMGLPELKLMGDSKRDEGEIEDINKLTKWIIQYTNDLREALKQNLIRKVRWHIVAELGGVINQISDIVNRESARLGLPQVSR